MNGTFTGTGASVAVIAADEYRDFLCIQMIDATETVTFGFDAAAVIGEGITFSRVGDSIRLRDRLARGAVRVIASGAGGICVYQDGDIVFGAGPTPAA